MTAHPGSHPVRGLLLACHLGPTVAVTLFGTALAAAVGLRPWQVAVAALAVLTGQLSVGWSNDWIDAGRDVAVARTDKPIAAGLVTAGTVRTAAFTALAACVPASLALGWRAGLLHLAAVASAWTYNAALKNSPVSWLPYAFSFGALPSVATLAQDTPALAPWWATATGALLGVGAHLANVLPDLADDRATGVHGLPHRLGALPTTLLAAAALLAASAVVVLGPDGPPAGLGWAGLAAAGVLTAAGTSMALARGGTKVAFTTSIAVAGIDVGLLVMGGSALA